MRWPWPPTAGNICARRLTLLEAQLLPSPCAGGAIFYRMPLITGSQA
ncbi:hypothetical protein [Escherichia coli]